MQLKKSLVISLVFIFVSPVLFASVHFGTYTYTIDTVISMLELSLIEEGVIPNTEEFEENVKRIQLMVEAFGEDELVTNMKAQSPFTSIEINNEFLILRLQNGEFSIPIEIIKNEIYSKDPESLDKIIGFFKDNKLYFNFILTFDVEKQTAITNECRAFYLIPFEREG